MARAAGSRWPERGPFPGETSSQNVSRIAKQWVAMTALAAAFFIIAPRLATPKAAERPPIAVAILFPAIVFGIGAVVQYFRRERL
jgi:nitric oxide reductase large subunit